MKMKVSIENERELGIELDRIQAHTQREAEGSQTEEVAVRKT